jgi:glycosyltransferase involved in cell wall biosynthesis
LGNVSDVRPVFAASDVSVLSSIAVESFSIAMLESMAMEVPVIASDIGGLREAIQPGSTGFLVPPGEPDRLSEAIRKAVEDRAGTAKMGKNARLLVARRFTTSTMVAETQKVLSDVLAGES